ncbi:hypothetical protein ACBJ59_01730 [Nonomuraea sp. MTCD27]|uniref:hypothetical protein n=1 Tax=Nonomuraea sp. MTCD27 TaxID=1676747 RepID=UPI0035C1186D
MSGYSRRDFLSAVGVSGGAGALFAAMGALGLAPSAAAAAKGAFDPPGTCYSPATVSGRFIPH